MNKFLIAILLVFSIFSISAEEKNFIIVPDNGLEMFHWDLDFVREAQESIEISACFLGGTIAQELLAAIDLRLQQVPDLQVYFLTTPILLEVPDFEMIAYLEAQYPNNFHLQHSSTVITIWPDIVGIDNHIKMFIVDGKYFSAGGTNLDQNQCTEGTYPLPRNYNKFVNALSESLPCGMRDQDIVGSGPMAEEMRETFHNFYALWESYNQTGSLEKDPEKFRGRSHYFKVTKRAHIQRFETFKNKHTLESHQIKMIVGGPHQARNAIQEEYVRLIREAEKEILIANLYSCPVGPIFNALTEAVQRGVKLTLLTNGVSDVAPAYTKFFCWANRIHYVPLFYGGAFHFWEAGSMGDREVKDTHIFEYHVQDVLLHKKVMVVDGKKCVVGSYNLGTRSDKGDFEMIMRIDSKAVAADIEEIIGRDLQLSREISPQEACTWYFDLITSYLGEMQMKFHGLL